MNRRLANILLILAVVGVLLYLLKSVLLPFVAGILVAYFLDPAARARWRPPSSRRDSSLPSASASSSSFRCFRIRSSAWCIARPP